MTKKITALALSTVLAAFTSCADNSNNDHTDVDETGNANTQTADTNGHKKPQATDTGTSGVNYSKVKK